MAVADEPQVGQIVDHYFLWFDEQAAGRIEGRKSRPCLIIAIEQRKNAAPRVTVLPITSQEPRPGTIALAVPDDVKGRTGLSRTRPAWVIIDDANVGLRSCAAARGRVRARRGHTRIFSAHSQRRVGSPHSQTSAQSRTRPVAGCVDISRRLENRAHDRCWRSPTFSASG
jgi:hypothetical protein